MHSIFVYGTLMYPRLLESFGIGKDRVMPDELTGYSARVLSCASFPGLVEDEGHIQQGKRLIDITDDELSDLDRYESEGFMYHRIPVKTKMGEAQVYLWADQATITPDFWEPEEARL